MLTEYVPDKICTLLHSKSSLLIRAIAFLFYALSAFLMNSYVILERRISWQPAVVMWITAMVFGIQSDAISAFTLLLLTVVIGLLFKCDSSADVGKSLYRLFAIVVTFAVFFPPFFFMLPLLFVYSALTHVLTFKSFMASLLGMLTPAWIACAFVYLFPQLSFLFEPAKEWFFSLSSIARVVLSPSMILVLCAELFVTILAISHFFTTVTIGRTLLRRRMVFCIIFHVFLWFAGWLKPELFMLFFVWRLSVNSLLTAYVFPVLPSKISNICLVSIALLWLSAAIIELLYLI